jgi:hypothetical protein
MSKVSYTNIEAEEVITAANLNNFFEAVQDATDGTVGKVDTDNVRTGAITQRHLAQDSVHDDINTLNSGSTSFGTVRTSGIGGAAESWVQVAIVVVSGSPALLVNEVIRYGFNLLIGDVTNSGGNAYKAQQIYYLQVIASVDDGGGAYDLPLSPIFGYGIAQRSSNDAIVTGSAGDDVAGWTRNPITGVHINRAAARQFINIRLMFRFNINDEPVTANTVETCHCSGYFVREKM